MKNISLKIKKSMFDKKWQLVFRYFSYSSSKNITAWFDFFGTPYLSLSFEDSRGLSLAVWLLIGTFHFNCEYYLPKWVFNLTKQLPRKGGFYADYGERKWEIGFHDSTFFVYWFSDPDSYRWTLRVWPREVYKVEKIEERFVVLNLPSPNYYEKEKKSDFAEMLHHQCCFVCEKIELAYKNWLINKLFGKKIGYRWSADFKDSPVEFPGKGENSWDCGMDGAYSLSMAATKEYEYLDSAVSRVLLNLIETRERRGFSFATIKPKEGDA